MILRMIIAYALSISTNCLLDSDAYAESRVNRSRTTQSRSKTLTRSRSKSRTTTRRQSRKRNRYRQNYRRRGPLFLAAPTVIFTANPSPWYVISDTDQPSNHDEGIWIPRRSFELGLSGFHSFGGASYDGYSMGLGVRATHTGLFFESQLTSDGEVSVLRDLNTQVRLYFPLSQATELYPLIGAGVADPGSRFSAGHLDLGVGVQVHIARSLTLSARYSARVIAENIGIESTTGQSIIGSLLLNF